MMLAGVVTAPDYMLCVDRAMNVLDAANKWVAWWPGAVWDRGGVNPPSYPFPVCAFPSGRNAPYRRVASVSTLGGPDAQMPGELGSSGGALSLAERASQVHASTAFKRRK